MLIAVDINRQKELDANPKEILQKKIRWESKTIYNSNNVECMSVLTILQRNQRSEIKLFSRKCRSIVKDKKLSRSGSKTNKCITKQIEIRRKK